jgi:hypothetical protein
LEEIILYTHEEQLLGKILDVIKKESSTPYNFKNFIVILEEHMMNDVYTAA